LKEIEVLLPSHLSDPLLQDIIRRFRDDELEHLDIAIGNFSQRAMHFLVDAAAR